MARKKKRAAGVLVLREPKALARNGGALLPNERSLTFGDRWAYAPAPEQSDYIKIKSRYQLFIDGKFRAPHSGKHFASINPATEGKLAEIAEGDAHDVDLAVKAARRAYEKVWSKIPGRDKAFRLGLFVLIIGPKGTGKTTLVRKFANSINKELFSVNFSREEKNSI